MSINLLVLIELLIAKKNKLQSPKLAKSSIERRLGGTDPFNVFGLINDSKTDLALHHCETTFDTVLL